MNNVNFSIWRRKNIRVFKKKYDDKEVECPKCHQKVKPILKLNRTKSEFYGYDIFLSY